MNISNLLFFTRFIRNCIFISDYFIKNSQSTGPNSSCLGTIGNSFMNISINRRLISRIISRANIILSLNYNASYPVRILDAK